MWWRVCTEYRPRSKAAQSPKTSHSSLLILVLSYCILFSTVIFVVRWISKFIRISVFLMTMSNRTTKRSDKYWPIWRFSKCPNGNKAMFPLMKSARGFTISHNGILKLKPKSKILPKGVWTLMAAKSQHDLRISFSKSSKHIRLSCRSWWLRKWVKPNKLLRSLLKYSTSQRNKISCLNNMVSISKVITTFCPRIRPCKTKRFRLKICKVN